MNYNPHLMAFVEHSNALSGIYLNDSKLKPKYEIGLSWSDVEFVHHYDVLEWAVSLVRDNQMPDALEVNTKLMEVLGEERYAGRIRHVDIVSRRIVVPAIDVKSLFDKWEVASQRFAEMNQFHYSSETGKTVYQGCPVCQACWLHKVFMYIRPFHDGNARTARILLAAHQIAMGKWPLEIVCNYDLPVCYYCRDEYEEALAQFSRNVSLTSISELLDKAFTTEFSFDEDEVNNRHCQDYHGYFDRSGEHRRAQSYMDTEIVENVKEPVRQLPAITYTAESEPINTLPRKLSIALMTIVAGGVGLPDLLLAL